MSRIPHHDGQGADATEERLPIEGGEVARRRGATLRGAIDSADSRPDGTFSSVIDEDEYVGAADDVIAQLHAVTVRIENGEGSSQGSNIGFNSPDFPSVGPEGPFVLTGEGADEGSTAVLVETPGPGQLLVELHRDDIAGDFLDPPTPPSGG